MTHALTLMQWLSPGFPVGAFAYSHGLEQVLADGSIQGPGALQDWLEALITDGSGWSDAVLLCAAHAARDPAPVDAMARASAASAERLRETDRQGAAFCDTVNAVWHLDLPRLAYPVAVGTAARAMGLARAETTALYLHAFAANLTNAAQRAMPLGQTAGQQVLAALGPAITDTAARAAASTLEDLTATSFAADIAAMRHETLQPRIFQT